MFLIQVRLENKIAMHYGILRLDAGTVTIMGGLVQSLYDEWQMSRKYSGFSRSLMRLSQNDDGGGPPPFEKLTTEACQRKVSQLHSSHGSQFLSHPKRSAILIIRVMHYIY